MKAAQLREYGGETAIKTANDLAKPEIKPNQLLVKVHAAGVNPFDWKVREGFMKDFIPLTLPAVLGGDVAGVVAEIGEDVVGFKIDQPVYGQAKAAGGAGSFAEYVAVNVDQLIAKPEILGFAEAAALPLAATSAYQALAEHINLQPKQKILIHGAAGGIGSFAVQIAKNIGAFVAATAADEDAEYVKSLGADEVIDYKTQDFSQLIKDYDAVFDTVGGETNAKSYTVLKPSGKLVSMVEAPNEELRQKYQVDYIQQSSKATSERLAKINELIETGNLKINVDKSFTLDQASEALEYLKTGSPKGKVVIKVT